MLVCLVAIDIAFIVAAANYKTARGTMVLPSWFDIVQRFCEAFTCVAMLISLALTLSLNSTRPFLVRYIASSIIATTSYTIFAHSCYHLRKSCWRRYNIHPKIVTNYRNRQKKNFVDGVSAARLRKATHAKGCSGWKDQRLSHSSCDP